MEIKNHTPLTDEKTLAQLKALLVKEDKSLMPPLSMRNSINQVNVKELIAAQDYDKTMTTDEIEAAITPYYEDLIKNPIFTATEDGQLAGFLTYDTYHTVDMLPGIRLNSENAKTIENGPDDGPLEDILDETGFIKVPGVIDTLINPEYKTVIHSIDSVYVNMVIVDPAFRGRKLTTLLYKRLYDDIAKPNGKPILLRTWSTNMAQLKILDRNGFNELKREINGRKQDVDNVYFIKY